jgi:hypothetical protein
MTTFSAATFRTLGAAATTHNLFAIMNTGSARIVSVRRLVMQMDATAVLTAVMPIIRTSRIASASGGTTLTKTPWTATASHADIVARGATASDGGGATAITATPGNVLWQQYGMRLHTAVGQVLGIDNNLLPLLAESSPVILASGQGLLVQVVAAAGTSNPATNHWFVQCVWDEVVA